MYCQEVYKKLDAEIYGMIGRRLFPQIPLHLRGGTNSALSSGDRDRLEGASRQHRHGRSCLDAAGGTGVPRGPHDGFQSGALSVDAANPRAHRP